MELAKCLQFEPIGFRSKATGSVQFGSSKGSSSSSAPTDSDGISNPNSFIKLVPTMQDHLTFAEDSDGSLESVQKKSKCKGGAPKPKPEKLPNVEKNTGIVN